LRHLAGYIKFILNFVRQNIFGGVKEKFGVFLLPLLASGLANTVVNK